MATLACEAPPRKFDQGGTYYTEFCNRPGRLWTASKNGHSAELKRCDHHAAHLRANGYDVRLSEIVTAAKKWDMTSLNSLEAATEWFRDKAGAVAVIVLRATDESAAVAEGLPPGDIPKLLVECLPTAVGRLEARIAEARAKAVHKQNPKRCDPRGEALCLIPVSFERSRAPLRCAKYSLPWARICVHGTNS